MRTYRFSELWNNNMLFHRQDKRDSFVKCRQFGWKTTLAILWELFETLAIVSLTCQSAETSHISFKTKDSSYVLLVFILLTMSQLFVTSWYHRNFNDHFVDVIRNLWNFHGTLHEDSFKRKENLWQGSMVSSKFSWVKRAIM